MVNVVDDFLDRITMYRLMLYFLIGLVSIALVYSFFGVLPFSPFAIIFSTFFLILISWISNKVFATFFKVSTNVESVYITALILALIITPSVSLSALTFFGWAGVLSMASKYISAINKKHIFNPVAITVALTAITLNQSASWWVGNGWTMPFVVAGGLLIVRKIRREDLLFGFLATALAVFSGFIYLRNGDFVGSLSTVFFESPFFFFAFVMLTEPLTTPPAKKWRLMYGVMIGILFAFPIHLGKFYSTPEIALVLGNIFSYIVSPKQKLLLTLKEKFKVGSDIFDFIFVPSRKISFLPGQYMEWTLAHKGVDSRGSRRYFTIASSPTENNLRLGVKFYPDGSSYKRAMSLMDNKTQIVASQLAGDFVLPKDMNKKLVFIAGGIGITPYRSMVRYLLDTKQKRQIILLYSNKTASEIMYKDVLDSAKHNLGIKTVYTLTEKHPVGWKERTGRIDAKMIEKEIPDWKERFFYLSGPHAMVAGFEQVLKNMGVNSSQIKTDFFPGYV